MDQEHRQPGGQEQGGIDQQLPEGPGGDDEMAQGQQSVADFHQFPAQPHVIGEEIVHQVHQEAAGQQLGVLDHVADPEDEEHDADDDKDNGRRWKDPGQEQHGSRKGQHGPQHGGGFHQKEQTPACHGGGHMPPACPAQRVISQSPQCQHTPPVPGAPYLAPYPFRPRHPKPAPFEKVRPHGSTGRRGRQDEIDNGEGVC